MEKDVKERLLAYLKELCLPAIRHSFEELARWFLHEQRRIESADLDRELKQRQLLGLCRRLGELAERLFEDPPTAAPFALAKPKRPPLLLQESCQ